LIESKLLKPLLNSDNYCLNRAINLIYHRNPKIGIDSAHDIKGIGDKVPIFIFFVFIVTNFSLLKLKLNFKNPISEIAFVSLRINSKFEDVFLKVAVMPLCDGWKF
jgi:hypothetical protein